MFYKGTLFQNYDFIPNLWKTVLNFLLASKKSNFFSKEKLEIVRYLAYTLGSLLLSTWKIILCISLWECWDSSQMCLPFFYTPMWFYMQYFSVLGYTFEIRLKSIFEMDHILLLSYHLSTVYLFSYLCSDCRECLL